MGAHKSAINNWIAWCSLFTAFALLVQLHTGAYDADHGQNGDEASYYVSSLMIADYLRNAVFSNPLSFAKNYYAHFPRVALGHYPPMFILVQSAILFLVRNGKIIAAFLGVMAGCCAGIPAAWVARRLGWLAGLCTGVLIFLSPVMLFLLSMDMTEPFFALLITLTALSWAHFYENNNWGSAFLFSALAAAACLTKGTALFLFLLPVLHLVFQRNLKFLFSPKPLIIAVLVGLAVMPWYLLTYKLAAGGFNYHWGVDYSWTAIRFFSIGLVQTVSFPIIILFAVGIWHSFRVPQTKLIGQLHAFIAVTLAMLLAPMVIPADLTTRYLIPAVPGIVIVSVWALFTITAGMHHLPTRLAAITIALVVFVSVVTVFRLPHLEPYHSDKIAKAVTQSGLSNSFVLVVGESTEEGAVISSFAEQDRARTLYVLRSSKLLSSSDFMGRDFRPKFTSPNAMASWIRNSDIGWLIVAHPAQNTGQGSIARVLDDAIASRALPTTLVMTIPNNRMPGGSLSLYRLPAANSPPRDPQPILSLLAPSNTL